MSLQTKVMDPKDILNVLQATNDITLKEIRLLPHWSKFVSNEDHLSIQDRPKHIIKEWPILLMHSIMLNCEDNSWDKLLGPHEDEVGVYNFVDLHGGCKLIK